MKRTGRHISKKVIMLLPFCLFTLLPLSTSAQTFTQRIQQSEKGEATVTVHHNKDIDDLVNGTKPLTTAKKQTDENSSVANQQAKDKKEVLKPEKPKPTVIVDSIDTSKKVIRGGHKAMGFRVQVFAGGNSRQDRLKAEQARNRVKSFFPSTPVYVHFYPPRWLCRVGNYRTYEEANQMLMEIRNMGYGSATIVKEKITVQ